MAGVEAGPAAESFAAYAATRGNARFTDWLRDRAQPDWDAAVAHRFTQELGDDRLDDAVFVRYLVQDYVFVEALVTLVGFAVAYAPDMAAKKRLATFLAAVTSDENDYFERSFTALGLKEADWADPALSPVTRDFMAILGEAGAAGSYADCLSVMVPAEWIYLTWAKAQAGKPATRSYLKEWTDLHVLPEFEDFVNWLRGELDRAGAALSDARQAEVAARFRRLVALEVAFFDAAYLP